jgi:hypothetical protein
MMRAPSVVSFAAGAITVAAVCVAVPVLGAASADRDAIARATHAVHAAAAKLPGAEFDRDPTCVLTGRVYGSSSGPVRVQVVDRQAFAALLATSAARGLPPYEPPIRGAATVAADGSFTVADTPEGNYSVFLSAAGCQPAPRDDVLVRDSIGGTTSFLLRPAATTKVPLPIPLRRTRVLPLYAGHWPRTSWLDAVDGTVELERRDPDGWPVAALYDAGGTPAWCRVEAEPSGGLRFERCELLGHAFHIPDPAGRALYGALYEVLAKLADLPRDRATYDLR